MKVKIKARIKDVFAEQTVFLCLVNSYLQTLNGNGIFGADINIALACTRCIAADCHCLNDAVRVALKNGAVHKCAGVALVGVADNIFLVSVICCGEAPFKTCGESAAASAAKTRILNNLNNLGGSHLR